MDIVERLRDDDKVSGVRPSLAMEAADEIERLRIGNRLHLELAGIKEAEIKRLWEQIDQLQNWLRISPPIASLGHGCACPVGAEKTCSGPLCPRSKWPVTAT